MIIPLRFIGYSKSPNNKAEQRRIKTLQGLLTGFGLEEDMDYEINEGGLPTLFVSESNAFRLSACRIEGAFQVEKYLEQNAERLRKEK